MSNNWVIDRRQGLIGAASAVFAGMFFGGQSARASTPANDANAPTNVLTETPDQKLSRHLSRGNIIIGGRGYYSSDGGNSITLSPAISVDRDSGAGRLEKVSGHKIPPYFRTNSSDPAVQKEIRDLIVGFISGDITSFLYTHRKAMATYAYGYAMTMQHKLDHLKQTGRDDILKRFGEKLVEAGYPVRAGVAIEDLFRDRGLAYYYADAIYAQNNRHRLKKEIDYVLGDAIKEVVPERSKSSKIFGALFDLERRQEAYATLRGVNAELRKRYPELGLDDGEGGVYPEAQMFIGYAMFSPIGERYLQDKSMTLTDLAVAGVEEAIRFHSQNLLDFLGQIETMKDNLRGHLRSNRKFAAMLDMGAPFFCSICDESTVTRVPFVPYSFFGRIESSIGHGLGAAGGSVSIVPIREVNGRKVPQVVAVGWTEEQFFITLNEEVNHAFDGFLIDQNLTFDAGKSVSNTMLDNDSVIRDTRHLTERSLHISPVLSRKLKELGLSEHRLFENYTVPKEHPTMLALLAQKGKKPDPVGTTFFQRFYNDCRDAVTLKRYDTLADSRDSDDRNFVADSEMMCKIDVLCMRLEKAIATIEGTQPDYQALDSKAIEILSVFAPAMTRVYKEKWLPAMNQRLASEGYLPNDPKYGTEQSRMPVSRRDFLTQSP